MLHYLQHYHERERERERERESKLTKTLWHIITELTKEMCVSRMPWSYMMEIDDFDKR